MGFELRQKDERESGCGMKQRRHSFLSLEALAGSLGLPAKWLRTEADALRIPCLRVNGRRLFDIGLVRQALAKRMTEEMRASVSCQECDNDCSS